jgi:hypothetical protein
MKKYVKEFLLRGAFFGGFGPIVLAIIYLILSDTIENFSLNGIQVFVAIISTYLIAFLHAGASVFQGIESWPLAKSLICHFSVLYFAYVSCYLVNSWIPFEPIVLIIFTVSFIALYFLIWLIVFLAIKCTSKRFNKTLN